MPELPALQPSIRLWECGLWVLPPVVCLSDPWPHRWATHVQWGKGLWPGSHVGLGWGTSPPGPCILAMSMG